MKRSSGILMHISSLPSPHGIGTLGEAARRFIDFLTEAGQSYWQLLPVCPTGYGDSPYQTFSTFAGNPYFIDPDELEQEGLLNKSEYENIDWESEPCRVNFGAMYQKRYPMLRLAAERFLTSPPEAFHTFCVKNARWLDDYALFMSIKNSLGGLPWDSWPKPLRDRRETALSEASSLHRQEILFHKALQFLFFRQWHRLHEYAHKKNVKIIGDLPFYVAPDSADVWTHPRLFQLDKDCRPTMVAGCPPDGFSADGQLWGNPLYHWEKHAEDGYRWWFGRIEYLCGIYDVLRIDHFRGFDSYFAIPAGAESAAAGSWRRGPGIAFFREMEKSIGPQTIIAEDLGFATDSVKTLLRESGFPGMKVLELGFDRRDADSHNHLPNCYPPHCIAYTGTHDNDTIQGWISSADREDVKYAIEYLNLKDPADYHWEMMNVLLASAANVTILQAQDLLGLGSETRMNTPSTLGRNWQWRALPGAFDQSTAKKLRHHTELHGRI